jgi:hypothetical protein
MATKFLKRLLEIFCRHQFSWPYSGVYGQDYQVCMRCGAVYEYDWGRCVARTGGPTHNRAAAKRSRVAAEGWGAQLLARQSRAGNWGEPKEDRGLLITLYSLVVLKDLGLDQ